MNTHRLTPKERFNLVMECRNSGLTDRQWCREKDISPSTFYRWISRFRANGFPNVPEPIHRSDSHKALKQEVVKLSVLTEASMPTTCNTCESQLEQVTPILDPITTQFIPVAEIIGGGITLRISNDIHPEIAGILISHMRGAL